jgi:F-type H+-transporting ATPase subunit b
VFNIDFTFVWTLVNLIILFFFLKKFLFGRVGDFLEQRKRKLDAAREASEKEREELRRLRLSYEAKIAAAGDEVQAILKAAKEKAERTSEGILTDAHEEAKLVLENARARIEAERTAALLAFKAEAAALVVRVSGKLLERSLDSDDKRRLARSLLDEGAAQSAVAQSAVVKKVVTT